MYEKEKFVQKEYKNENSLLFTVIYPKMNMNVVKRQFCFDNNFPMHIKENTDFFWQRPQQLPSAEANLEGCEQ